MAKQLVITNHRPRAGQEIARYFLEQGYTVHVVSTPEAGPSPSQGDASIIPHVVDRLTVPELTRLLTEIQPTAIVHAPQNGRPSSGSQVADYQAVVNGTLFWLEAARLSFPRVPFAHISSSLVYGDRANTIDMTEQSTRIDFSMDAYINGVTEAFPIENSTHSLPGAAAVAADVLAQEYSRSHHLLACCFRVDSLCDPGNGTEDPRDLLSQIASCCLTDTEYLVQGNRGKQVREIIPARDLAALLDIFFRDPQPFELYNVGGAKVASCSVNEAIQYIESLAGKLLRRGYTEAPPLGEPRCYYSDPRHIRYHYPKWRITEHWKKTAERVVEAQKAKLVS